MASLDSVNRCVPGVPPAPQQNEVLKTLVAMATVAVNAQIGLFTVRLADAFMQLSESSMESKEASLSFNIANLLKKNSYAYYYLASVRFEKALQQAMLATEYPRQLARSTSGDTLALVSYEEVEQSLLLTKISRQIELANTDRLDVLGMRLAHMLHRDQLPVAQNPFRPEIFVDAAYQAWLEFDLDPASQGLMLPLLQPDIFIDLAPIIQSLNEKLIACGILPDVTEAFRIRKTGSAQDGTKNSHVPDAAMVQQLRHLLSPQASDAGPTMSSITGGGESGAAGGLTSHGSGGGFQAHVLDAAVASNKLLGYLAGMQKHDRSLSSPGSSVDDLHSVLPHIKAQAPHGAMNRVDEHTIDLLIKIFDVVFRDRNIPQEIKALIGFLQVPVLKAALLDKEFFFQQEHPARRVIELVSQSGIGWDQKKGESDPLYQTIKRNVERIEQAVDQDTTVFAEVVAALESFIDTEENQATEALAAPITEALRQEKIGQATKVAMSDVAARIGTGDVVAFVETFLEEKWVTVLAIAYQIQDEKPQAVASAVKTMDDLIWSVKPKMTIAERKELVGRLPTMLAALNKWLNVVKWVDADRLQFFADLAECHASIVRAPIDMSPQRQLEIAIDVAKAAAERRLAKRTAEHPITIVDDSIEQVGQLTRGVWVAFQQPDGSIKKVKLAWISPLRRLFIFSTSEKTEAFSLSVDDMARAFREQRAQVMALGGLVERALTEAMATAGANDPAMETQSAA